MKNKSKMATGEMEITDQISREIESSFGLPSNWLDRDNEKIAKMSREDYELMTIVLTLSQDSKKA